MKRTVWADEQVTASVNKTCIPVMIDVDDPDYQTRVSDGGGRIFGKPSFWTSGNVSTSNAFKKKWWLLK